MLACNSLKNHSGVLLNGDYWSLRRLHQTIHEVNDKSPLIKDEDGPFLGFAYDVRKAYEQAREVIHPPSAYLEVGMRYGVKITWPEILAYHRILRVSFSYIDSSLFNQAVAYSLEAAIDEAINDSFGRDSEKMRLAWHRLEPRSVNFIERIDTRASAYCSWEKSKRRKLLPFLLESMMTEEPGAGFPKGYFAAWEGMERPSPGW